MCVCVCMCLSLCTMMIICLGGRTGGRHCERTDHPDAPRPGAHAGFCDDDDDDDSGHCPPPGVMDGRLPQGSPPPPPSSSSGMQPTWDGHVRLVCRVCVCVCVHARACVACVCLDGHATLRNKRKCSSPHVYGTLLVLPLRPIVNPRRIGQERQRERTFDAGNDSGGTLTGSHAFNPCKASSSKNVARMSAASKMCKRQSCARQSKAYLMSSAVG